LRRIALSSIRKEWLERSAAYASALNYLVAGAALLPGDPWGRRHELIFELELQRAECEFVTGVLGEAEDRLAALSTRAATTVQRAAVACMRVDLYMTTNQSGSAVALYLNRDRKEPGGLDRNSPSMVRWRLRLTRRKHALEHCSGVRTVCLRVPRY